MSEYGRLSKTELVARLQALEQQNLDAQQLIDRGKKLAETALRDGEERMRAILQTAVEGIITIDGRGIVESMNPAAEEIFGYKSAEVMGKNVSMLMPSPYRENHDRYLDNYQRTGHAKIIGIGREVIGQRKDGSTFPMALAVSEVRLANKMLFTGFVRDITEQKRLEREILQISENEQRRIGQDLHDGICQHLAGIELMSQVLEQNLEKKKSKTQAAQAEQIAREVRDVITQTRALARGLSPLVIETEGLTTALSELAAGIEKRFRVTCEFSCDPSLNVSDLVASTHIYRIAQEAASNAIKHGKATQIEIALAADSDKMVLSVRDNGTGIPVESAESTGMGLRIMRYRAGIIGGAIEIHNLQPGTIVICTMTRPT